MVEQILERLQKEIEADKKKGYKGSGSVDMEMPKDVFGHYDGCSFSYRLQIWQPRKPYKPLKALTWLECP